MTKTKVAIIGPGNIGTDLMFKVMRLSTTPRGGRHGRHRPDLRRAAPRRAAWASPPRTRASTGSSPWTASTTSTIVFDATSAKAHVANAAKLAAYGKKLVDLTPAAIGPYVVPPVNLETHLEDDAGAQQRQHGHLRRPGDDPDRGRDLPGHDRPVRRDRRLDRVEVGRARAPAPTSTSSPRRRPPASSRSAAPSVARRSSSSTPPSRR